MIRQAQPEELEMILGWAAIEGWNPGLADAQAFHGADPGGFFVNTRDGVPVAGISMVNHDDTHAFLGLYLCLPDWRGRGLGLALWRHAVGHAGLRVIGLDGVAAQQDNYVRSGFKRFGATQRFTGTLEGEMTSRIRPLRARDMPALIELDSGSGGVNRRGFLSNWLRQSSTRRTVVRDDLGGFATIRQCQAGAKIGPVIAPNALAALELIRGALAQLPAEEVSVDLPQANAPLRKLLVQHGFTMGFETARMYRGTPPESDARVQAIATMELG